MCDAEIISRLYASVLHEDILKYRISSADIRTGIQNMKEVYLPNPTSLSSAYLDVANYDDPAHRCAYLHKYAPFHTALVAEMLRRAVLQNPKLFRDMLLSHGTFNICSLGGGPGSDVIGTLSVLNKTFGFFQVSATVIDCMSDWRQTFASLIQELRYGSSYGTLGQCVSDQYFKWTYLGSNLLGSMSNEVNKAISSASMLTMIKFVSASACKDTPVMIKKIFNAMKPGALVLYIDNAGGGFHQIVVTQAIQCNLVTVFGPLKHEQFATNDFNVKRFGYTPCLDTKVSVHLWRKPTESEQNQLAKKNNRNRQRSRSTTPGRRAAAGNQSWNNFVDANFQGFQLPQNANCNNGEIQIRTGRSQSRGRLQNNHNINSEAQINAGRSQSRGLPQSNNNMNNEAHINSVRLQSRGRLPNRSSELQVNTVRSQSRRVPPERPSPPRRSYTTPGNGYRPAPSGANSEDEYAQNCCCVIS